MEGGKYIRRSCCLHLFGLGETSSSESVRICDSGNAEDTPVHLHFAVVDRDLHHGEAARVGRHVVLDDLDAPVGDDGAAGDTAWERR